MELQNPPTQLKLPNSPPPTPHHARHRKRISPNANYYAVLAADRANKRRGIANFSISPPDYISPQGEGHQFSYTPPDRDRESSESESDVADDDDESETSDLSNVKGKEPAPSSDKDSDIHDRRPSVIRSLNEDTDFTIEELSDDDIGYDDHEIIYPDSTEDARSDLGSKASERDILDSLKDLTCGDKEELERARRFETAQRETYRRRKKRWSVGGYKKRSHAQSVGSQSSGHEDVEPLDHVHPMHLPGEHPRRLRRRTQGPEEAERPSRTSLIFEDPPRELEELAVIDEPPPPLSDSDGDLWSDDDDSDGIEEVELLLPHWLMELESNPPSRPSTAVSVTSVIRDRSPAV